MQQVTPKVFLIGENRVVEEGLSEYLNHIGVPEWKSDAPTDLERIIETMGRTCYRSFRVGLNPNVSKIRGHNKDYLENIVKVAHGSVVEHGYLNFIFADVSRVFTHELVRHRVGLRYDDRDELSPQVHFETTSGEIDAVSNVGISQESLRFVRLDNLNYWVPRAIRENKQAMSIFLEKIKLDEQYQKKFVDAMGMEQIIAFEDKKEATSAMRRMVSMGVATSIGWSANIRTIRSCLEARTYPGAEEEIRLVFGQVGKIVCERYRNLFADYKVEMVNGLFWYRTEHPKI